MKNPRLYRSVTAARMDVDDLELLATVGAGVSLAHRSAMQSSLPLLRRNYKLSAVRAWGKLSG